MNSQKKVAALFMLMPYWHYKIEKPFKQLQKKRNISFETYFCLLMLKKHGAMKMSEIALALKLSKQQTTQMIDTLYQHHFVERCYDTTDRRIIRIAITKEASEFLKQDTLEQEAFVQQFTNKLTKEEQEDFDQAINTLLHILPKLD